MIIFDCVISFLTVTIEYMNVAQLMHHQLICPIPHCPTFVIYPEFKHYWYFYSAEQRTLRKKPANTSLYNYLSSLNDNCRLLIIKQVDWDRPLSAGYSQVQITTIVPSAVRNIISKKVNTKQKVECPKDDEILRDNQWKPDDTQKLAIIKLQDDKQWTVHSLFWSPNIVKCTATLSGFIQNKLTDYCVEMKKILEEQIFNDKEMDGVSVVESKQVREFQLIFRYKDNQGLIQLLLIQKVKVRDSETLLYTTNFKAGEDKYERIQIEARHQQLSIENLHSPLKDIKQSEIQEKQCEHEANKMRYLAILRKLAQQPLNHNKISSKANRQVEIIKQYSCSACNSLVVIYSQPSLHSNGQNTVERLVSSNRIPEIQMSRQIRIRKTNKDSMYELVPVCEICYSKFVQFYHQQANSGLQVDSQPKSRRVQDKSSYQRGKSWRFRPSQIKSNEEDNNSVAERNSKKPKKAIRDNTQLSTSEKLHPKSKHSKITAEVSFDGTAIPYDINSNNQMTVITSTTINRPFKRSSLVTESTRNRQKRVISMSNNFIRHKQSMHREGKSQQKIQSENDLKLNQSTENRSKINSMQLADALREYEKPNTKIGSVNNRAYLPRQKGNGRKNYKFARKYLQSNSLIDK